jgi:hypothetical protein
VPTHRNSLVSGTGALSTERIRRGQPPPQNIRDLA